MWPPLEGLESDVQEVDSRFGGNLVQIKISAKSTISLLYVTPESFQCLFGDSLNRMDSFLRAQPATAAKPRWLPPFVRGTFPTTVKVTYPLYEWAKPPARGIVPTKPLTVQLPPKEGETEATNIPWDKVAPGMMLRIRVSPLFKTRSS